MKMQKRNSEYFKQQEEFFIRKKEFFEQQGEFFKQEKEFFGQKEEFLGRGKEFFIQKEEANSLVFKHDRHLKKIIWGRVFAISVMLFAIYNIHNEWLNRVNAERENRFFSGSYYIEDMVYIVESGDTLWDIAREYMGSEYGYPIIAKKNGLGNPHLIFPGDVLMIPIIYMEEE